MQYLRKNCIDINVRSSAKYSYILDFVIFTKPTLKACTTSIRIKKGCPVDVSYHCLPLMSVI